MNSKIVGPITRRELVKILHEEGYTLKPRTVESWQTKGLLPPFDARGRGRGKGKGRVEGSWSNGELVVSRTVCVLNLLSFYGSAKKVYVPLVMLGYNVPRGSLKDALTTPVVEGLKEVMRKAESFGNLEDALLDSAGAVSEQMCRTNIPLFSAPFEMLDAIVNIFFNENYDFGDSPFETGRESVREWESELRGALPGSCDAPFDVSFGLFENAQFVNRYLSVPAIRKALEDCSDDELESVECDLKIIGEIGYRFIEFLLRNMPPQFEMTEELAYGALFKLGTYFALADLSLRTNGLHREINILLEQALKSLQEDAMPALSSELPIGRLFADGMLAAVDLMSNLMTTPAPGANNERYS